MIGTSGRTRWILQVRGSSSVRKYIRSFCLHVPFHYFTIFPSILIIVTMAEQDRHESHFGANPDKPIPGASRPRLNFKAMGSGAEQDRYGSHFSIRPENPVRASAGSSVWPNTSGLGKEASASEQDRYGSHFSLVPLPVAGRKYFANIQ